MIFITFLFTGLSVFDRTQAHTDGEKEIKVTIKSLAASTTCVPRRQREELKKKIKNKSKIQLSIVS